MKPKLFFFKVIESFDTTIRAKRIDNFATEVCILTLNIRTKRKKCLI